MKKTFILALYLTPLLLCENSPVNINTNLNLSGNWVTQRFHLENGGIICKDTISINAYNEYTHYLEFAPNDCDTGVYFWAKIRGKVKTIHNNEFYLQQKIIEDSGYAFNAPFTHPEIYNSIHCKFIDSRIYLPQIGSLKVTAFTSRHAIADTITGWHAHYSQSTKSPRIPKFD